MNDFHAKPLTPDRWQDFETLFGPQVACYGCWCTHFRIPADRRKTMDGDQEFVQLAQKLIGASPREGTA